MKVYPVLFYTLLFFLKVSAQPSAPDSFDWRNKKLEWSDFSPRSAVSAGMDPNTVAYTLCSIDIKILSYDIRHVKMSIKALFSPTESFLINGRESGPFLAHEQIHFDIAEVYARKVRKLLLSEYFEPKNFNENYQMQVRKITEDFIKAEKIYDLETNHSINTEQQAEWSANIAEELAELASYSSEEIVIYFK